MSTSIYKVLVSEYTKTHFIKSFSKKYKNSWNKTFEDIKFMLSHIDNFLTTTKVEKIHICDNGYIAKCEFKIVGSNESSKTSGNRIIVYVDEEKYEVNILLLYCKTDILGNHETSWWRGVIKENYGKVWEKFRI